MKKVKRNKVYFTMDPVKEEIFNKFLLNKYLDKSILIEALIMNYIKNNSLPHENM